MVAILRVRAEWSGFSGAPGFTVLHFRDFGTGEGPGTDPDSAQAQSAATRARDFFTTFDSLFPDDVSINVDSTVDMIEDSTGTLIDSFSITAPLEVNGTATASYSAAAGAVVNWKTGSIRNGRRIRGRSFLVPLASTAYSTTGDLLPSSQAAIQNAANSLVARTGTPDLGVYARPTGPAATDGQWAVATSAAVPSMSAILRSRRD